MDNYGGIFDCYYAYKGSKRSLVMAGVFTCDDINKTVQFLQKDFVEQFIKHGREASVFENI